MKEKFRISLKFVSNGSIDNKSVLVQAMVWHRAGDMPIPEPMLISVVHRSIYAALEVDKLINCGLQQTVDLARLLFTQRNVNQKSQ